MERVEGREGGKEGGEGRRGDREREGTAVEACEANILACMHRNWVQ